MTKKLNSTEIKDQLITMCNITHERAEKDGIEFYVKLKGYKETDYIPVTISQLRDIETILELGCED